MPSPLLHYLEYLRPGPLLVPWAIRAFGPSLVALPSSFGKPPCGWLSNTSATVLRLLPGVSLLPYEVTSRLPGDINAVVGVFGFAQLGWGLLATGRREHLKWTQAVRSWVRGPIASPRSQPPPPPPPHEWMAIR